MYLLVDGTHLDSNVSVLGRPTFSLGMCKQMSQLLNQDSRNTNPGSVRRPVGGHFTGIPDDPRKYSVVPTMMELPPNSDSEARDVDPRHETKLHTDQVFLTGLRSRK